MLIIYAWTFLKKTDKVNFVSVKLYPIKRKVGFCKYVMVNAAKYVKLYEKLILLLVVMIKLLTE